MAEEQPFSTQWSDVGMGAILAITTIGISFLLLRQSFLKRVPKGDRRFMRRCIFFAFILYLGFFVWVQYFFLQGKLVASGDQVGYHLQAIWSLQYFKQGIFLITGDMIQLNYPGYPAYFLAPIYLLAGNFPVIAEFVQLVLCFHIAIRIYDLTALAVGYGRRAKMAFFFALFFPEVIGFALQLLKDLLILWCIVNLLYYAARMHKYGVRPKDFVSFVILTLYLATLRTPIVSMAVLPGIVYIIQRYRSLNRNIMIILLFIILAIPLRGIFVEQLNTKSAIVESASFEERLFPEASSPLDALVMAVKNPLRSTVYMLRVFKGIFAGGVGPIFILLSLHSPEEYEKDYVQGIFDSFGVTWRLINCPITLLGLWIILRKYRYQFSHILIFTASLMLVLFVSGYGGRWGLPGMIPCSIAWGIGFHEYFQKRKIVRDWRKMKRTNVMETNS
jgi:hypothetical protein